MELHAAVMEVLVAASKRKDINAAQLRQDKFDKILDHAGLTPLVLYSDHRGTGRFQTLGTPSQCVVFGWRKQIIELLSSLSSKRCTNASIKNLRKQMQVEADQQRCAERKRLLDLRGAVERSLPREPRPQGSDAS